MKTVGIRALKQNASAVVSSASRGEVVIITDRGRPVAQLTPLPSDTLKSLVDMGHARASMRALADLGRPPSRKRDQPPLSKIVEQMRSEERY